MHTLLIGFDSFDPITFEHLASQGKMPFLNKYTDKGNYSRFTVSDPPQTEVSWSSIATGLDAGWHGVFDFVHRNPRTYTPYASLLPTKTTSLGTQFIPPVKAKTIFEQAAQDGYPTTTLWYPATFPAQPSSPVRTIPGLGTPDILGRLGVGTYFSNSANDNENKLKTPIKELIKKNDGIYGGSLDGPAQKKKGTIQNSIVDFALEIDSQNNTAKLNIGKQSIPLIQGQWSQIIEITFKMGLFFSIRALTQTILNISDNKIGLYFLPLQIHPMSTVWRYATPPSFVKQTWKNNHPFLTLGWPQDTTALEEGFITDEQFLSLCKSIFASRERIFMHNLDDFSEGIFGVVFDSLDRIQHMFRKDHRDIVEDWYIQLDSFVGRVENRLASLGKDDIKLFFLSDHGFSEFNYKVNLNYWLIQNGYLSVHNTAEESSIKDIDWSQSSAYAVGLNSIYFNLKNREGQGIITSEATQNLSEELINKLLAWEGPDRRNVIHRIIPKADIYTGPRKEFGPDLLVGYASGYRASSETGLGGFKRNQIETNSDHWGADHCIDSQLVPGVLFSNQSLKEFPSPSFRDIPYLTIGKEVKQDNSRPPKESISSEEDDQIIEERLKSLGYL